MSQASYLLSTTAVRERCRKVFEATLAGRGHFQIDMGCLPTAAEYVARLTRENFSDLKVPPHSRWAHFEVGGTDRLIELRKKIANLPQVEQARILTDLVVISVLLDAGAGPDWKFQDRWTGQKIGRSEGLALASLEMFTNGAFSSHGTSPAPVRSQEAPLYGVTPEGLAQLTIQDLAKGFQVSPQNPLVGLEGRFELLKRLGQTLGRPGKLVDQWLHASNHNQFTASHLLQSVLTHLGPIWPSRLSWEGTALGDTWHCELLGTSGSFEGLVPFHKLSQWLTFSLLHPAEAAGLKVTGLNELTGLPEYRNGGLFLDLGVLKPRIPDLLKHPLTVDSQAVVEWRALTVVLIDELADPVRKILGRTREEFPLPALLEGGTWRAGRKIAKEKRPDGSPPIHLISDGTVF